MARRPSAPPRTPAQQADDLRKKVVEVLTSIVVATRVSFTPVAGRITAFHNTTDTPVGVATVDRHTVFVARRPNGKLVFSLGIGNWRADREFNSPRTWAMARRHHAIEFEYSRR